MAGQGSVVPASFGVHHMVGWEVSPEVDLGPNALGLWANAPLSKVPSPSLQGDRAGHGRDIGQPPGGWAHCMHLALGPSQDGDRGDIGVSRRGQPGLNHSLIHPLSP